MPIAILTNRRVLRLTGEDTRRFLQGLITQDIALLERQRLIFSAMLSAQGKFAYDFFIQAEDDVGVLIDIDASLADAFLANLKRYKLRSKVTFEATDLTVCAAWGDAPQTGDWQRDPRIEALGWRHIGPRADSSRFQDESTYDAHRLSLAIPDGAQDGTDRLFALEMGYDQLHGVSFDKGCFIGQEPTARMHYRNVLRKGFFGIRSKNDEPLPPSGTPIVAGEKQLGHMHSSRAGIGLAICRMEYVTQAHESGVPICTHAQEITACVPDYMQEKWALIRESS